MKFKNIILAFAMLLGSTTIVPTPVHAETEVQHSPKSFDYGIRIHVGFEEKEGVKPDPSKVSFEVVAETDMDLSFLEKYNEPLLFGRYDAKDSNYENVKNYWTESLNNYVYEPEIKAGTVMATVPCDYKGYVSFGIGACTNDVVTIPNQDLKFKVRQVSTDPNYVVDETEHELVIACYKGRHGLSMTWDGEEVNYLGRVKAFSEKLKASGEVYTPNTKCDLATTHYISNLDGEWVNVDLYLDDLEGYDFINDFENHSFETFEMSGSPHYYGDIEIANYLKEEDKDIEKPEDKKEDIDKPENEDKDEPENEDKDEEKPEDKGENIREPENKKEDKEEVKEPEPETKKEEVTEKGQGMATGVETANPVIIAGIAILVAGCVGGIYVLNEKKKKNHTDKVDE